MFLSVEALISTNKNHVLILHFSYSECGLKPHLNSKNKEDALKNTEVIIQYLTEIQQSLLPKKQISLLYLY